MKKYLLDGKEIQAGVKVLGYDPNQPLDTQTEPSCWVTADTWLQGDEVLAKYGITSEVVAVLPVLPTQEQAIATCAAEATKRIDSLYSPGARELLMSEKDDLNASGANPARLEAIQTVSALALNLTKLSMEQVPALMSGAAADWSKLDELVQAHVRVNVIS